MKDHVQHVSDKVAKLMSECSTLKNSGRMRLLTALRPKTRNVTRWTSGIDMLERYIELYPKMLLMDNIDDLMPDSQEHAKIKRELPILNNFREVTIELQKRNITLAETEDLFDFVTETYEDFPFENYLSNSATIVASPVFESAIVKIQNKKEGLLTEDERDAVLKLRKLEESMFFTLN